MIDLQRQNLQDTSNIEEPIMLNLTRIAFVFGSLMLLAGCTAAGSVFDNNCSGNGWIYPGDKFCADYVDGP